MDKENEGGDVESSNVLYLASDNDDPIKVPEIWETLVCFTDGTITNCRTTGYSMQYPVNGVLTFIGEDEGTMFSVNMRNVNYIEAKRI